MYGCRGIFTGFEVSLSSMGMQYCENGSEGGFTPPVSEQLCCSSPAPSVRGPLPPSEREVDRPAAETEGVHINPQFSS